MLRSSNCRRRERFVQLGSCTCGSPALPVESGASASAPGRGLLEGFTLAKFLEPDPPFAARYQAEARDESRSWDERLNAALRAAILDPNLMEAREVAMRAYLEVSFAALERAGEEPQRSWTSP